MSQSRVSPKKNESSTTLVQSSELSSEFRKQIEQRTKQKADSEFSHQDWHMSQSRVSPKDLGRAQP